MGRSEDAAAGFARSMATVEIYPGPCHVIPAAYGPEPITWSDRRIPVWIWMPWAHTVMERIPGWARGWNSRVVMVVYDRPGGDGYATVWRAAVTHRRTD